MSLDRSHDVVRSDHDLESDQGDRNRPAGDGIVRAECASDHDVHGKIPEGDLSLPAWSETPCRSCPEFTRQKELPEAGEDDEGSEQLQIPA
jgi:hypothetical protein